MPNKRKRTSRPGYKSTRAARNIKTTTNKLSRKDKVRKTQLENEETRTEQCIGCGKKINVRGYVCRQAYRCHTCRE